MLALALGRGTSAFDDGFVVDTRRLDVYSKFNGNSTVAISSRSCSRRYYACHVSIGDAGLGKGP